MDLPVELTAELNKVQSSDKALPHVREIELGFKISGRLSVGAGGVYRIGISDKFERWAQGLRVYGYRGYSDVEIVKGLFVHAEVEQLKIEAFTHAKRAVGTARSAQYQLQRWHW